MNRLVLNTTLYELLQPINEVTELCDPQGRVVGYYYPTLPNEPPFLHAPYTPEELEEFRKQKLNKSPSDMD